MKCKQCGSSNRRGVKYCEWCGTELKAPSSVKKLAPGTCPSCGFKNRKGVKFCEECGTNLKTGEAPEPVIHRLTDEEAAPPVQPPLAPQQHVQPIVVRVKEKKKQRLNPLWLLILLLLLLVCCSGLLLIDVVKVPKFAAPYVEPYIEPYLDNARDWFDGFIEPPQDIGRGENGNGEKGEKPVEDKMTCEEFREIIEEDDIFLGGIYDCDVVANTCDLIGGLSRFDCDFNDLEISYRYKGGPRQVANCEGPPTKYICHLPYVLNPVENIDIGYSLKYCEEEYVIWKVGWIEKLHEGDIEGKIRELAPPSEECCKITKVTGVHYEGTPGVTRFLHFDAQCDEDWPVRSGDCIPGETFIGADQDIPWADVSCCAESDDLDVLHCVSDSSVEQKVSWTIVRMEGEGCEWESPKFYTPEYFEGSQPSEETETESESDSSSSGISPSE